MAPKKKVGGSSNWVKDINDMYERFKFFSVTHSGVRSEEDLKRMRNFLKFRISLFQEEFVEMQRALDMNNSEEIVDASIDIMVIAIGNLLLFGVDPYKAWDEVLRANNGKTVGDKPGRNNFGTPDLSKPRGWKGPSHMDNHGLLDTILQPEFSPILTKRFEELSVLPKPPPSPLPPATMTGVDTETEIHKLKNGGKKPRRITTLNSKKK